ncbi:flippase [Vibrio sp. CAU 1672]|uniref:flippase n=1 Tax=Vibrio sp. CAU 1672 TaxID=3032594 RepID=UPI0023DA0A9A|nr:flippase [Vibrio sp. CAU 1672]MDF2155720.1 flippase [Vibrio sp. CAU 1672]
MKPSNIINKFKKNSDVLSAVKNSLWLVSDKFVRLVIGLLVGAWVARYLGPAEYGILAYVLAMLSFFQVLALLGMDGIIVRNIASNQGTASSILGTSYRLRLVSGITCYLIAAISIGTIYGFESKYFSVFLLAGGILVFQSADTVDLWFQSQSQSKRTIAAKLTAYIIAAAIKVLCIKSNADIKTFAFIVSLESFLSAVGLYISYKKFPTGKNWFFSMSVAKDIISESWPFILSSISILIYMRIDQLMIKSILGDEKLGVFAAVIPLATLWTVIPMVLSTSIAPMIARAKSENESKYMEILRNVFTLYSLIGWVVSVTIFMFSEQIIQLLFGSAYIDGAKVLSISVFSNVFINLGVAQSLWILNERKPILSLYKTFVGAIVCIVANLFLIPKFGIIGAAYSSILSQAISAVLLNLILDRRIFNLQIKSLFLIR